MARRFRAHSPQTRRSRLCRKRCELRRVSCDESQNVHPACNWYVRGATKCVPLNVDRKLYSATLFVRLMTLNRRRSLFLSVRNRLSIPTPRSNRSRGATRDGLFRGSPVPAAGTTSRLAAILLGAQLVKPAVAVAATPPHDTPAAACCAGVSVSRSSTSPIELATNPESYRQLKASHAPVFSRNAYCTFVVALNF